MTKFEIDNLIEAWQNLPEPAVTVYEFLGITKEQYEDFTENGYEVLSEVLSPGTKELAKDFKKFGMPQDQQDFWINEAKKESEFFQAMDDFLSGGIPPDLIGEVFSSEGKPLQRINKLRETIKSMNTGKAKTKK